MPSGARITWLASYPKSGNTWFRVFLANYLSDGDQPISINALYLADGRLKSIASARHLFSDTLGIDAGDFTPDEYDCLRPDAYRALARQATQSPFLKIHDANINTPAGEPLIPVEATERAIYFVRNPLDVAVSFANHAKTTVEQSIADMGRPDHAFCASVRGMANQLRQRLLTWSGHVESWTAEPQFPTHVIRYEDMLETPMDTFGTAISVLGLPADPARLAKAIEFSRFDELRKQESSAGFQEAPPGVEHFFYQGRAGAWRDHLTPALVNQVIGDHAPVMARFGYLDCAVEHSA
jgi:hypothetical protein